jgi:beta-galactosidase/arabinogalactan endo-1,4-beta-galactosidase
MRAAPLLRLLGLVALFCLLVGRLAAASGSDWRPVIGADISWLPEEEAKGRKYSVDGVEQDLLTILRAHGFNWIRLRLFHNPRAEKGYSTNGYCGLEQTLDLARRVKQGGFRFLLNFHYSDTWADPAHQHKPSAWTNLHGRELERAVREYTRTTLVQFQKNGTPPDMVQVGNEISAGFLWPDGQVYKQNDWKTFCGLFRAGAAGVKAANPATPVMLHLALGGQNAKSRHFLDQALTNGVTFDVLGQSYYPEWHGTLGDLRTNLTDLVARYGKPVMVVEYTAPNIREIHEIVLQLPGQKGQGACIWEPTRWGPGGGALFDRQGRSKPELKLYPTLSGLAKTPFSQSP